MNIVVGALRHMVPLLPLYLLNGSIESYLLLTAFDLALGLRLFRAAGPLRRATGHRAPDLPDVMAAEIISCAEPTPRYSCS